MKHNYFKDTMYPYIPDSQFYKDKIFIGWNVENREEIYLDLNDNQVMLIVGPSGSGKTWLLRSIIDRAWKFNSVAHLSDIKGEMASSRRPLQAQFKDKIRKDVEFPKALKLKMYMPQFLAKKNGSLPKDTAPCQFSLVDLTLPDLYTIFNVEDDANKKQLLTICYDKLQKGSVVGLEGLKKLILGFKEVHYSVRQSLSVAIDNLLAYEVVGDEGEFSMIKDIINGNVGVLNLFKYEFTNKEWTQTYVAIALRKIREALRDKELKKMFVICDEANRFIPATGNPSSKREFIEFIDVDRIFHRNLLCATQDLRKLDPTVLAQSRYVFLSHNVIKENYMYALKEKGYWTDLSESLQGTWMHIKKRIGPYRWLLLDSKTKDWYILKPTAPLSAHQLE